MSPLLPPGLAFLLRAADAFMHSLLVLFLFGLLVVVARSILGW